MIIILSPAKTLDFSRKLNSITHTEPLFNAQANQLAKVMKNYTTTDLLQVMKMSEKLAELTYERFQNWDSGDVEMKQAGAAFKGEAYNGLDMPSLSEEDLDYAQDQLCILSGMYGLLRPFDIIKPYRLEMGSKLKESSLYALWKEAITTELNAKLTLDKGPLINLASNEYFKSIEATKVTSDIITPIFKEKKNGKLKTIVVYTKKARGLMARYIIQNQIQTIDELKQFDSDGYCYDAELSDGNDLVFVR